MYRKLIRSDSMALSHLGIMPPDTLQVILEPIFTANLLTSAKHSAFSTNRLTDTDKTKHNDNQLNIHWPLGTTSQSKQTKLALDNRQVDRTYGIPARLHEIVHAVWTTLRLS